MQVKSLSNAYIPLVTQNHSRWVSRWLRPPTPQFRVGDTNMLVSKNAKICLTPNANSKICITPNANPLHEQVEYRSPGVGSSRWAFHLRLVANANAVFSGIWALYITCCSNM